MRTLNRRGQASLNLIPGLSQDPALRFPHGSLTIFSSPRYSHYDNDWVDHQCTGNKVQWRLPTWALFWPWAAWNLGGPWIWVRALGLTHTWRLVHVLCATFSCMCKSFPSVVGLGIDAGADHSFELLQLCAVGTRQWCYRSSGSTFRQLKFTYLASVWNWWWVFMKHCAYSWDIYSVRLMDILGIILVHRHFNTLIFTKSLNILHWIIE